MIRIAHLLDDFAMGGVTRALSLFDDPRMAHMARSSVVSMPEKGCYAPTLDADLIVIHAPPSWGRLPYLTALRWSNPQARIVQIQHSYTRAFERLHVSSSARFRLMLCAASKLVDEVIAVSKAQSKWLAETGVPDSRISVIHPWSGRFGLSFVPNHIACDGPLRLLAYGRFSPEKNYDALIKAVGTFSPDEVRLTLFGDGPEKEALSSLARGIAHVTIHPTSATPSRWLKECDAVVLPSHSEAFGLVATEARMAGRAVLVADVDGLPEQARAGGGMVAALTTPTQIAHAIRSLMERDLTAMGQAARAGVAHQHDEILSGWHGLIRRASVPFGEKADERSAALVNA